MLHDGRNPFVVQVFGFGNSRQQNNHSPHSRNPFVVQVFGFN